MSRVNHSPKQESNAELTTTAISGLNCIDLFWKYDHVGCFLKMCMASCRWKPALTGYSLTWIRSATPQGRSLYRLRLSAPTTGGIGSGSSHMMPTPSAHEPGVTAEQIVDKDGNPPAHPNQRLYDKHTGRGVQQGLKQVVELWPTPTTAMVTGGQNPDTGGQAGLRYAALSSLGLWPTPKERDYRSAAGEAGSRRDSPDLNVVVVRDATSQDARWRAAAIADSLHSAVQMFPTPNAAPLTNELTLTCSGDGREKPNKLGWAVANEMLPPPTTDDAGNVTRASGDFQSLTRTVQMFATPRHEGFDAGAHRGKPDSLHSQVKMMPTPTVQDEENTTGPSTFSRNSLPLNEVAANGVPGLKLSAAWVTRLMMYPDGWLDDLPPDPIGRTVSPASPPTSTTA